MAVIKHTLGDTLAAVSRRDLFWFAISFMNVSLALAVMPLHPCR